MHVHDRRVQLIAQRLRAQRQVHDGLADVAARLAPGATERDAARMIRERLAATSWFHEPYVWFGDRTAPRARRKIADFTPSERRLEAAAAVILDAAPIIDGMIVDASYTSSCGRELLADLAAVRAHVPQAVQAARGPNDVYRAIDELVTARGGRTCHRLSPFGPLAHRVDAIRNVRLGARVAGVDVGMLAMLGGSDVLARISGRTSPLWSSLGSSRPSRDGLIGLWSVEPHVARGDVGAKFEEILVVDHDGARWLDDTSWLTV